MRCNYTMVLIILNSFETTTRLSRSDKGKKVEVWVFLFPAGVLLNYFFFFKYLNVNCKKSYRQQNESFVKNVFLINVRYLELYNIIITAVFFLSRNSQGVELELSFESCRLILSNTIKWLHRYFLRTFCTTNRVFRKL